MQRLPLTVLHTSDWQCGRPFLPRAAEALLRLVPRVEPDVVVASGDLTQRAKVREYRTARELLDRFADVPVIATPGNHDVPLYRVWERLLAPFRNWRRFIDPELDTVARLPGATFVSLSSAAPHRAIVNGRLTEAQLDLAERVFAEADAEDLRCLVVHHHLVPIPGNEGGPPMPDAPRWLDRIEAAGTDVVFGGHLHQTHNRSSRDVLARDGPGVPVLVCGTTMSRRGRGSEAGRNSLNVVRIAHGSVEVTPHRLEPDGSDFEPLDPVSFQRPRARRRGSTPSKGTGR